MAAYDTFIVKEFEELKEEEEMIGIIRSLEEGKKKYKCYYARFIFSKDRTKYPDTLWVRLGRGQLVPSPCSMKILEFIDPFKEAK